MLASNGKSLIIKKGLYSFFFAFFPKKNEAWFFHFSSSTQLLMQTFVLLRSCKILKIFTSFCFLFTNFWNTPIRFTIGFEKVGLIPFDSLCSSKIWNNLVVFNSIFFISLGTSSSFVTILRTKFVFASIFTSCMLILFLSLRYLTFFKNETWFLLQS